MSDASLACGASPATFSDLAAFAARARRLFVLTGAGCSTRSGIPDYRDREGEWKRSPPMRYQTFVSSEAGRRRYWARSLTGFELVRRAEPSSAHRALAVLEKRGRVDYLVTQNVDGLHQKAGSQAVNDLHGRIDRVRCLDCGEVSSRSEFQDRLFEANPSFSPRPAAAAPDGDADVGEMDFERFEVPSCRRCGGVVKPDVVFFGESVPAERVDEAMAAVEAADALLVVGSSLMVWSGYRFVRRARQAGAPVASINLGRTRADDEMDVVVRAECGATLTALADAI